MIKTKTLKITTDDNSTQCSLPVLSKQGTNEFLDYIINRWVEKDGGKFWTPYDKKQAKAHLKKILNLMSAYKLECLLNTIIEIDKIWNEE